MHTPAYGLEENSILEVRTLNSWISKIKRKQRKDATILNTREQLSKRGVVESGQLRKASAHLNLQGDTLYFNDRIVLPRYLRREALEKVRNECHFGQARTLELVKRSYFWYKMTRDVKIFGKGCLVCKNEAKFWTEATVTTICPRQSPTRRLGFHGYRQGRRKRLRAPRPGGPP